MDLEKTEITWAASYYHRKVCTDRKIFPHFLEIYSMYSGRKLERLKHCTCISKYEIVTKSSQNTRSHNTFQELCNLIFA